MPGQRPNKKDPMAYVPFSSACNLPNSETPISQARINRQNARVQRVANIFVNGNNVLGDLVTRCCSNASRGGQGYDDDDTTADLGTPSISPVGVSSVPAGAGSSLTAGSAAGIPVISTPPPAPPSVPTFPLTPVDIITGTNGFPVRSQGSPWPRPKLPTSVIRILKSTRFRRRLAAAYPNYRQMVESGGLVPQCPCLSSGPPVRLPVPKLSQASGSPPAVPALTSTSNFGGFLAAITMFGIVVWAVRK